MHSTINRIIVATVCVACIAGPIRAQPARTEVQKEVDDSVVRALEYLSAQQNGNGSWSVQAYGESTAATSLAVMAFMAAGHMPGEGPYGEQILRGIRFVVDAQHENGMLVAKKSHGPMYSHGISTLMLAEVAGMLGKEDARRARAALEKGVLLILAAQNVAKGDRHQGGWRYDINSTDSDLSVTGWQLLALRAAKNIGCDVPADNIDRAVAYVKMCTLGGRGGFCYQPNSGPTPTRTGTGILCLEICGEHQTHEAMTAADYLLEQPLRPHSPYYFYGVYYCTVGMFKIGGRHWEQARDLIVDQLLAGQNIDGSWSANFGGERDMGKVYCTCMSVLGLAVEYQFLPIYQR